jgi:hypothetical protein
MHGGAAMSDLNGVYVVLVPPDVSDEPVRWCFVNQSDADLWAEAHGSGAYVSWEPVSWSLEDTYLDGYMNEVTTEAREAAQKLNAS